MDKIKEALEEWLREILTSGITTNLDGLFDQVNTKVGEIATQVGQTPQGWNASIYNMIKNLSDNVMVPIVAMVLAFVMSLELIQMVIDRNNLNDGDTFAFFKWVFKSSAACLIVTNTWNIVMAVFDIGQHIVNQAAGETIGSTGIDSSLFMSGLEEKLAAMTLGELLGLWVQTGVVKLCMGLLQICILVVVFGGSSPSTSFDCSGYVSWVINHSGWNVGRLTATGFVQHLHSYIKGKCKTRRFDFLLRYL